MRPDRVSDPEARARARARGAIAGVHELAALEREAAAPDALSESGLEPLELGDALVDAACPGRREARPVVPGGSRVRRKPVELARDLAEREAYALREDDERDPAQHRAAIAAMSRAGALGLDQT